MAVRIKKRKLVLYLFITAAFLFHWIQTDRAKNPGEFTTSLMNNFWQVIYTIGLNLVYFEFILPSVSKRIYQDCHTDNSYMTKMSTHKIEQLLPDSLFKRIHRSFIVAIYKIRSFNSEMVEINGRTIPVGRSYKNVLEKL